MDDLPAVARRDLRADLDRSIRFFCDGLGFEQAEGFELDSDRRRRASSAASRSPATVRIMSQFVQNDTHEDRAAALPSSRGRAVAPSATRNQVGLTHLSLRTSTTSMRPPSSCWSTAPLVLEATRVEPGIDLLFLADPDGVRVELMALPREPMADVELTGDDERFRRDARARGWPTTSSASTRS